MSPRFKVFGVGLQYNSKFKIQARAGHATVKVEAFSLNILEDIHSSATAWILPKRHTLSS